MFYNADWLEQLEYDAPPQGWDEFSDMCTAARDSKAGLWGYAYEADGAVLVNWISGLGGTLIDHNSGQAALDCPEATAALSLLQGLIKEESAYCISESGADCADFAAGKTLFTFGSTADLAEYAASEEGTENLRLKGHTSWQISHPKIRFPMWGRSSRGIGPFDSMVR